MDFFFSVSVPLEMLDKVTHVYTYTYMHEVNCNFAACNGTAKTRSVFCDKFMHALFTEFRCCCKPVISCSNRIIPELHVSIYLLGDAAEPAYRFFFFFFLAVEDKLLHTV